MSIYYHQTLEGVGLHPTTWLGLLLYIDSSLNLHCPTQGTVNFGIPEICFSWVPSCYIDPTLPSHPFQLCITFSFPVGFLPPSVTLQSHS